MARAYLMGREGVQPGGGRRHGRPRMLRSMLRSSIRWGLFAGCLFVAGPVAWLATGRLHGADGGHDTSALLSTTPVLGVVFAMGAVLLAGILGAVTSRLVHPHNGLFNAGMVLAWAAFGTGTIEAVSRSSLHGGAPLTPRLIIEGAILAAVAIGWAVLITPRGGESAGGPAPSVKSWGQAVLIGVAAGFVGAWLVAQNGLKGQTIAAGAASAVIGGAAAMLIDHHAPKAGALAGVCLMAALGPLAGLLMHGSSPERGYAAAAIGGTLLPAARVMPFDWLAGAFLGAPLGLSLGAWITEGRHAKPAGQAA